MHNTQQLHTHSHTHHAATHTHLSVHFVPQDENVANAVTEYGQKNWKGIATHVEGKSEMQCLHRWTKVIDPDLVKGPWTVKVCL